jgi:hypothetical protein
VLRAEFAFASDLVPRRAQNGYRRKTTPILLLAPRVDAKRNRKERNQDKKRRQAESRTKQSYVSALH